jgi:hypothetical protein
MEASEAEERGLITRVGSLEIDWPKSLGYFGGIALAVAYDLIAPPIGLFIAAIPVVKLFKHPGRSWPLRIVADAIEGAAKPVGGDAEATVRLAPDALVSSRSQSRPPHGRRGLGRRRLSRTV